MYRRVFGFTGIFDEWSVVFCINTTLAFIRPLAELNLVIDKSFDQMKFQQKHHASRISLMRIRP